MPMVSKAQNRLMQAIAHGWKPRGKKVPSRTVAREFIAASRSVNIKRLPERVSKRTARRAPRR